MVLHVISIIVICILAILFTFLPYFPGGYDHLAVMISGIIQIASFISLLLVPVGVLWLIYERVQRKKVNDGSRKSGSFAIAALVILTLIVIVSSFVAIGGIGSFRGSLALGISLPIIFVYITVKTIIPRIRKMRNPDDLKPSIIPYYMVIIPLAVVISRCALIVPALDYSTNYAIEQSSVVIQDLEEYYSVYGQYPVSLQGLWKDYDTNVMGIEKYYYEPNGKAYNLFFEQFSSDLFAREIVMYNKLDEHIIRSHPSFVFSLTPEEFESYMGYFAEFDLPKPHWKYFLFD
ncbi:hypothetical protein [Sedimentibacter sp.]|uniref:hypothetical protein n=1 Tax=Sedimentibacter sp. TaxID=1960295 RepID=UPI0028993CA8|nr:hypothetical protein [Sedimentibacter sp.]